MTIKKSVTSHLKYACHDHRGGDSESNTRSSDDFGGVGLDHGGMADLEIHHNDPSRLWASRGPGLVTEFVAATRRFRAAYADMVRVADELERDGVAGLAGYGSLPQLLSALTGIGAKQAKRLVGHAELVSVSLTPTGHERPAPLTATGEALRAAAIDAEHVDVIAWAVERIPSWVEPAARDELEAALAEQARECTPPQLRSSADRMLAALDQDGPAPDDAPIPEPRNELAWRRRRDGRVSGRFELSAVDGAAFTALIEPLAAPRPAADDTRTQIERNGDALAELCVLASGSPDVPSAAGERPHVNVTVPLAALESVIGAATLGDGEIPISAARARLLACDAKVIPYVLGTAGQPLDIGRTRYTVPTHLRRALILRDGGCAFPHCDRRARACDAHHVRHWADGGTTALSNLVLLCPRHHRLTHNSEWQVHIGPNGRPEFTPPAYLPGTRRSIPLDLARPA